MKKIKFLLLTILSLAIIGMFILGFKLIIGTFALLSGMFDLIIGVVVIIALVLIVIWMFSYAKK